MSDIQSIQVCSGLEQNRRHLQRSPCNPDIHNPDRISHHLWNLYTRTYPVQRQSIGHPIVFANTRSSTPIFKCNSQRRITYSEWVIRPHGPFPVNPNSERLFKNKCAFKFKQITSITHSKGNIDSRLLNYQWICTHHQIPNNFPNYLFSQIISLQDK